MRKLFIIWISLFVTAPLAVAQNTCKTCAQKNEKGKNPEVISYTIITKKKARPTRKKSAPRSQSYFKRNKLSVSRFYVITDRFPLWENDILSEQEVLAQQKLGLQPVQTQGFDFIEENWDLAPEGEVSWQENTAQTSPANVHGVVVSVPKANADPLASDPLQPAYQAAENVFDEANDFLYNQQQPVQQAYDQFNQNVNQAAGQFQDGVNQAWQEADQYLYDQQQPVQQAYDQFNQNVNQAWQEADQYLYDQQQPVQQAYDQFNQNVNQAAGQFQDGIDQAWQEADQYLYDQQQPVQQAYDQFNQNVNQAAGQFQDGMNQAWQEADQYLYDQQQPVQQAYDQFNQGVNQVAGQFQDGVNQAAEQFQNGVNQAVGQVQDGMNQVWQAPDGLSNDWEY